MVGRKTAPFTWTEVRMEMLRGAIQPQELERSEAKIRTFISGWQTSNPHLRVAIGIPLEPVDRS